MRRISSMQPNTNSRQPQEKYHVLFGASIVNNNEDDIAKIVKQWSGWQNVTCLIGWTNQNPRMCWKKSCYEMVIQICL